MIPVTAPATFRHEAPPQLAHNPAARNPDKPPGCGPVAEIPAPISTPANCAGTPARGPQGREVAHEHANAFTPAASTGA